MNEQKNLFIAIGLSIHLFIVLPLIFNLYFILELNLIELGTEIGLINSLNSRIIFLSLGSLVFCKGYIDNNFGWQHAIKKFTENVEIENPLIKQLEHFYDVINGICPPMVTATDATRSLSLALAVLGFDKDNIG